MPEKINYSPGNLKKSWINIVHMNTHFSRHIAIKLLETKTKRKSEECYEMGEETAHTKEQVNYLEGTSLPKLYKLEDK